MKKIIFTLLSVILILSTLVISANANYLEKELGAYKGSVFREGVLSIISTTSFDLNEYTGKDSYIFLGVEITEISYNCTILDNFWYDIYLADSVSTVDAIEILSSNEAIKDVYIDYLMFPDAPVDQEIPSLLYFNSNGSDVEKLKSEDCFISTVFIVEADRPLAPSEVDGTEYFFGLRFERFVDLSEGEEYRYEVKLYYYPYSIVPKSVLKRVIECVDGVTNVISSNVYGTGDANKDDIINKYDYILVKRMCMGTYSEMFYSQIGAADVTLDGTVDKFDYIMLKRSLMGIN